eukprot:CAMPEP_0177517820 /NCGR_PEP_ID=MMETSP0369-20130122/46184_1 /TAXON_ID=447022 ORGANISM="Scrippsiella hangoei-like, Strain SHHI-4" /NCGR_SAMPLE_ID=MMETSP0369 /ASSEMBLY_ACC=CAM_ASM_000364 /LENGTH=61 /DNA_ID=CAMNT_0018996863 /DNA_START=38 /DNA_END=220 /DNA_ORIENTATION=+
MLTNHQHTEGGGSTSGILNRSKASASKAFRKSGSRSTSSWAFTGSGGKAASRLRAEANGPP